jgi:hypothetical protein
VNERPEYDELDNDDYMIPPEFCNGVYHNLSCEPKEGENLDLHLQNILLQSLLTKQENHSQDILVEMKLKFLKLHLLIRMGKHT